MSQRFTGDAAFACDGKDKLTPEQARKIARRQSSSAYHCANCHAWHVGHIARKAKLLARRPRFYDNDEESS